MGKGRRAAQLSWGTHSGDATDLDTISQNKNPRDISRVLAKKKMVVPAIKVSKLLDSAGDWAPLVI